MPIEKTQPTSRTLKRLRLLALLLTSALLAAACGGGDSDSDSGSEGDESSCQVDVLNDVSEPVEIVFWHAMTAANETTINSMARDYNSAQDKVAVSLVNQTSYAVNFDTYRNASVADRPNIIQLEETALQSMIDSGTTIAVQACVDAAGYSFDDHLPRVVDAFTVDEVLWPMPFNISNPVLWYDGAAFTAAGLDPDDPPETLEELRETAEALVASGSAGFAFDTSASSFSWIVEQLLAKAGIPYVDTDNGRSGAATQVQFDSASMVEIITFFRDMTADGLAVNTGSNPDGTANFFAFLADPPASMTINTSAALSSVLQQLPILGPHLEMRVAPLPSLSLPDEGGAMVGGAALWLPAEKTAAETAAAWDFVRWLNEPQQQATWHIGSGYLPIRRSAAELPEVATAWADQPAYRVPFDQLLAGTESVASAGPVIGPHTLIRDELVSGLERVLLEGQDPAEMVSQFEEAANELIADYTRRTGG